MAKNIIITILSLMLAASLLGNVLLSVTLWGMIQANQVFSGNFGNAAPLPNITVVQSHPPSVPPGKRFVVAFDVTNTAPQPQKLHSIDVWGDGNDGLSRMVIHSTTPAPQQTIDSGGYKTYLYEKEIPPGQSMTIVFELEGVTQGDNESYFDICIGDGSTWQTQTVNVNVDPNAPTPPPAPSTNATPPTTPAP